MVIRQERPEDFEEIYHLVKTAFATAEVKDGDEQDFVNMLRARESYIPQLALVAEDDGRLVGHIMLTKLIIDSGYKEYEQLMLAPICVDIDYRSEGVGGALIKESFRLAQEKGYNAVFLCGNPDYYSRFGFRPASDFGIVNKGDIPQKYVQACELTPGALAGISGKTSLV